MHTGDFDRQLAKTFVKDFDIPMYVIDDFLFLYQVNTYGVFKSWNLFVNTVNSFPGSIDNQKEMFYSEKRRIENEIVNKIKESEAFEHFNTMQFPSEFYEPAIPTNKYGNGIKDNHYYLSVDLKSANIQALYYIDKNITFGENTWDGLIYKLNGHNEMSEYVIASKHIRQYVLGLLNPKRAITVEKHIMSLIYKLMANNGYDFDVVKFNNDEIVFSILENDIDTINVDRLKELIKRELGFIVHAKIYNARFFRLLNETNKDVTQQFMIRKYLDGSYDMKCVPTYLYGIVYKLLLGCKEFGYDKYFIHDNMKCHIEDNFSLVDDNGKIITAKELLK